MRLRRLPWVAQSLAAQSAVAEVPLSVQPPALPWELTGGRVGTAIMVIGAGIISITGVTAIAGSAHQVGDRM